MGVPGRSLSQPRADSSLYAREPLHHPQSEPFIGVRLFSVVGHPSSVRAIGPATLSGGEGDLRRGLRGGTDFVLHTAPHPSGLRPATLSQERVFPLPIWQKFKNLPPGKRRQVITLGSPKRGSLSRSLPSIACGKGHTLRARSTNRGLPCPGDPGQQEGSYQRRSGFTEA